MMISPRPSRPRRGFSLTVVLLFLLLLMYLWAVVYRTTSSLVRVQTARIQRDIDDAGMRNALAQALMFMESDAASEHPTLDHSAAPVPYTVTVKNAQVDTWPVDNKATFLEGPRTVARYTVTFVPDSSDPKAWKVEATAYNAGAPAPPLPAN